MAVVIATRLPVGDGPALSEGATMEVASGSTVVVSPRDPHAVSVRRAMTSARAARSIVP